MGRWEDSVTPAMKSPKDSPEITKHPCEIPKRFNLKFSKPLTNFPKIHCQTSQRNTTISPQKFECPTPRYLKSSQNSYFQHQNGKKSYTKNLKTPAPKKQKTKNSKKKTPKIAKKTPKIQLLLIKGAKHPQLPPVSTVSY
jgi:hypothetical protein